MSLAKRGSGARLLWASTFVFGSLFIGNAHADSHSVQGLTTEQEVRMLIEFVERSGCYFHRNGKRHDSEDAADHLRLKYNRGEKYVEETEDFIDRLATKSSWTGKLYQVECRPGEFQPSGQWLHKRLDRMRGGLPEMPGRPQETKKPVSSEQPTT